MSEQLVAPQVMEEGGVVLASRLTVAISALVAALGSVLPWVRVLNISVGGLEGDGRFTLPVALLAAAFAVACLSRETLETVVLAVTGSLFGLALLAAAIYNWNDLQGSVASAGVGLYLVAVGAVGMLAGVVMTIARH